jgi:membrane protease YdiL (CAAX protease family)
MSLLVFATAWLTSAAVLAKNGRPLEEPITLLLLFGLAFPALALLVCRGLPKLPVPRSIPRDGALIAALVIFITAFLAVKGSILAALVGASPDPRVRDTVNALLKLAAFVAIPLAAYTVAGRISPRSLGLASSPHSTRRRSLAAFVVIGAALAAVQLLLGRGARPLLDGSLAHRHWVLGVLLCFLWMSVEAGVVEEIFFRVVLQSRLAAVSRSPVAGVLLSALVFGLAHAPGLWLRGAGAIEGLGTAPSLAVSVAYSVTTMAVAGIVFGVLWARTRNWVLLVALHGLTDTLSNAPAFIATWKL